MLTWDGRRALHESCREGRIICDECVHSDHDGLVFGAKEMSHPEGLLGAQSERLSPFRSDASVQAGSKCECDMALARRAWSEERLLDPIVCHLACTITVEWETA